MKKFCKACGISLAYFGTFLAVQAWISAVSVCILLGNLISEGGLGLLADMDRFLTLYMDAFTHRLTGIVLLSNLVSVLLMWLFFWLRGRSFPAEIGLKRTAGVNLPLAILFGIGVCFTVDLLTSVLPVPESVMDDFAVQHNMLFAGSPLITFLAVALVGPFSEEVFFRGLCYTRLKNGMRPIAAGLLSAVLFGIAHGNPVWFLVGFLAGLAMAWIFEVTGSLWCSILVHITNNSISYLTGYFPMSEGVHWALIGLGILSLAGAICLLLKFNPGQRTNQQPYREYLES